MLFVNNYASVKVKSQHLNPGLSDNIGKAMEPSPQTEIGLERVRMAHLEATQGPCQDPRVVMTDCPACCPSLSPSHLATPKVLEVPLPAARTWTLVTMLPCPHGSLLQASRGHSFPSAAGISLASMVCLFCLL